LVSKEEMGGAKIKKSGDYRKLGWKRKFWRRRM